MDTRLNGNLYNETSSDEFPSDSSDDENESLNARTSTKYHSAEPHQKCDKNANLLLKLFNRENTGYFAGSFSSKHNQKAFNKVPSRLSFCLKDIVPYCYLQGHMFMGLTVCGQFLISYKVCYDENSLVSDYNFSTYYKYTLYFWIYKPHQPLGKFFKVCLFDDHGVDNLKIVTMTQWKTHPQILIVHGTSEYENEDSYTTIVRVPKLGCSGCKELRDLDADGYYFRCDALCIKCNLTIHTKYSTTESDPRFDPHINLICPERMILIGNGFIHMLHVELEIQKQQQSPQHHQIKHNVSVDIVKEEKTAADVGQAERKVAATNTTEIGCDNKNNIVARIIADFTEDDNETQNSFDKTVRCTEAKNKNYDELIFTCGLSAVSSSSSSSITKQNNNTSRQSKVSLLNHQGKRNHRIVTKTFINGVTTIDLQSSGSGGSNDKASAYEFSEDNEKCEKIGIFRKRRLADKKYEFSEDNSENIIPFTKARLSAKSRVSRVHRSINSSLHATCTGSVIVSTASSQSFETMNHLHRASPSQGFRSPCGSPVGGNRYIKPPPIIRNSTSLPSVSPQQNHSTVKPPHMLSPRQISATKRNHFELGNISPTAPFLSPKREDSNCGKSIEISLTGGTDGQEKPACTKKFKRRYVEEDDAASVITSEEDDCISPGYHTSLPMEVHGSCYSDMQMISQTSYQKLKCPTVIITQHSFDLETFTYYVISNLCQMNNKTYDVFYDWACELVNVCPRSISVSCILMAHFRARDQLPNSSKKCLNCSRNIDCVFHRKQFECRILFTWNMETGDWDVLDYGQLNEIPTVSKVTGGLTKVAKTLAKELSESLNNMHDYSFNLKVLDSNVDKSKTSLVDSDNLIEFYRKRPRLPSYDY